MKNKRSIMWLITRHQSDKQCWKPPLCISLCRNTEEQGKGVSPEFRTDKFHVLEYLLHCLEFSPFSFSLLLHPGQAGSGLEPVFRSAASAHEILSAIPTMGIRPCSAMALTLPACHSQPQHRRLQGDSRLMGRSTHEPQCHKSYSVVRATGESFWSHEPKYRFDVGF